MVVARVACCPYKYRQATLCSPAGSCYLAPWSGLIYRIVSLVLNSQSIVPQALGGGSSQVPRRRPAAVEKINPSLGLKPGTNPSPVLISLDRRWPTRSLALLLCETSQYSLVRCLPESYATHISFLSTQFLVWSAIVRLAPLDLCICCFHERSPVLVIHQSLVFKAAF
jgi:hypothetical protein